MSSQDSTAALWPEASMTSVGSLMWPNICMSLSSSGVRLLPGIGTHVRYVEMCRMYAEHSFSLFGHGVTLLAASGAGAAPLEYIRASRGSRSLADARHHRAQAERRCPCPSSAWFDAAPADRFDIEVTHAQTRLAPGEEKRTSARGDVHCKRRNCRRRQWLRCDTQQAGPLFDPARDEFHLASGKCERIRHMSEQRRGSKRRRRNLTRAHQG